VCTLTYAELVARYPASPAFAPTYCVNALYTYTILHYAYGFAADGPTAPRILFQSKLRNNDVGWALGMVLFETNFLPWRRNVDDCSDEQQETLGLSIGLGLASLCVVLTSLYICKLQQRLKQAGNPDDHTRPYEALGGVA